MKTILSWFFLVGGLCAGLTAADYNRVPAGQIKGARLSYVSASSIRIGVGYGEVAGSYWEIGATDPLVTTGYTLTGLTTTTSGVVQYLYIDRANSSFPDVAIRNSTTAPAWSASFMGWYDGGDRCIGALWVTAAGTLIQFKCPDDDSYFWTHSVINFPQSLPNAHEVYSDVDVSAYAPVNASHLFASMSCFNTSVPWVAVRTTVRSDPGVAWTSDGVRMAIAAGWLPYERGVSKTVTWMAYADASSGVTTTGTINLRLQGYRLER